jgi:hypothetical protein
MDDPAWADRPAAGRAEIEQAFHKKLAQVSSLLPFIGAN